MAAGDLTTGTVTFVDMNDEVALAVAIDAINLAATTDFLFVVPMAGQNTFAVFKVERE